MSLGQLHPVRTQKLRKDRQLGLLVKLANKYLETKLKKNPKIENHSVVHYQVGDQTVLYLKKPNHLNSNEKITGAAHKAFCTSYAKGVLTLDVRKNCGKELMEEFIKKYRLPNSLDALEINFIDKKDDILNEFLDN